MRQRRNAKAYIAAGLAAAMLLLAGCRNGIGPIIWDILPEEETLPEEVVQNLPDYVDVQLVPVNGTGRRGIPLEGGVKDIVIHYVGNPGTTAQNNHDYYAQPSTQVSSHFLVGLEGEVILCVPLDEKSSASNERNRDTISVEVCHPDETGQFNEASMNSLVKLTAWLCKEYGLDTTHIIRHYDVTGKLCPLYFVEHEDAWEAFKAAVDEAMQQ